MEVECNARALLIDMCHQVQMEPAQPTADAPVDDDDDILSFMQQRQHSPNTAVGEIDRYLPVTTDESVMSFWEDNLKNEEQFPPRLYWVWVHKSKHHCIPATSAAMERVFSAAGWLYCEWSA